MLIHLIDANNFIRRAFERGSQVTDFVNLNPSTLTIWVFDGKYAKKPRQAIYPAYKAKRDTQTPLDSGFFDFLRTIEQELLPHCGNTLIIRQDGMEADDLIAALANFYKTAHTFLIHSNDADFQALVCDSVQVTDKSKKLAHVEPEDIRLYKTLVGDPSDNIGGIQGFGAAKWSLLTEEDKDKWRSFLENEIPDWCGGTYYPVTGLTKQPLEWLKVTENQQLLRNYWQIVGFLPVNLVEVGAKCTVTGKLDPVKFQAVLDEFMWG